MVDVQGDRYQRMQCQARRACQARERGNSGQTRTPARPPRKQPSRHMGHRRCTSGPAKGTARHPDPPRRCDRLAHPPRQVGGRRRARRQPGPPPTVRRGTEGFPDRGGTLCGEADTPGCDGCGTTRSRDQSSSTATTSRARAQHLPCDCIETPRPPPNTPTGAPHQKDSPASTATPKSRLGTATTTGRMPNHKDTSGSMCRYTGRVRAEMVDGSRANRTSLLARRRPRTITLGPTRFLGISRIGRVSRGWSCGSEDAKRARRGVLGRLPRRERGRPPCAGLVR